MQKLNSLYVILFIISLNFLGTHSDGKVKSDKAEKINLPPCRACKVFVESFNRGIERTSKFKFEGGDTAWEEKNLGSYANSEVRFVEIHEKLCSEVVEGKAQCYQLLEEYDEALETWWFKKQKDEPDLLKHICIDTFEVCCPELHFGSNCTPCKGFPDNICNNNGKCKGSGTRKGNGKCLCDNGYMGDYCDTCADGFYESYRDDKQILCTPCHKSCEGKCSKAGPDGCQRCKAGYLPNKDRGCKDINECLMGKSPCMSSQFCVNTEGSYSCLNCHQSCLSCTGDGPDECINCAPGYVYQKREKLCVSEGEAERKSYISTTRYITYFGLCVCTCIILQKNVSIAAVVGVCVGIYITLSEYVANNFDPNADLKEQLTDQLNKAFGGGNLKTHNGTNLEGDPDNLLERVRRKREETKRRHSAEARSESVPTSPGPSTSGTSGRSGRSGRTCDCCDYEDKKPRKGHWHRTSSVDGSVPYKETLGRHRLKYDFPRYEPSEQFDPEKLRKGLALPDPSPPPRRSILKDHEFGGSYRPRGYSSPGTRPTVRVHASEVLRRTRSRSPKRRSIYAIESKESFETCPGSRAHLSASANFEEGYIGINHYVFSSIDIVAQDTAGGRSVQTHPGPGGPSLREMLRHEVAVANAIALPHEEIPLVDDPYQPTYNLKSQDVFDTGYCYVRSENHFSIWDQEHPECEKRCIRAHEAIKERGLKFLKIVEQSDTGMSDEELFSLVHPHKYIETLRTICQNAEETVAAKYDSIFMTAGTWRCVTTAAHMTTTMAKMVATGKLKNAFCNIRPPGHHAGKVEPNGYCLANNAAIAAKYCLTKKLTERVLILDLDVHHGNGTQQIFFEDKSVLYISIHRYENGTFWPNLREGNFDYVGVEDGKGYNINIPLNETGLDDADYLAIMINIVLPVAYEFNPTLIIISCGYDATVGCPEGEMRVTPAFYAHVISLLSGLAKGKIVVVLEGGYFIPTLAEAALQTVKALLDDRVPPLEYHRSVRQSVTNTINDVKIALRPHWKCIAQTERICLIDDIVKYDRYNHHVAVRKYFGHDNHPPYPTQKGYPVVSLEDQDRFKSKLKFLRTLYTTLPNRVTWMINKLSAFHDAQPTDRAQEVQQRINDILDKLIEFRLLPMKDESKFDRHLKGVEPVGYLGSGLEPIEAVIASVHTKSYLHLLKTKGITGKSDIYWTPKTYEVCLQSCAILCQLVFDIRHNLSTHGLGVIRPPGHHANADSCSGFCLINNVVVAANYAINTCGCKRVLIFDFDIHHGNGTQELTYKRNDIMYISMHRYDSGKYFPRGPDGGPTKIGDGVNAGFNLNIAFQSAKMGDADYLFTFIKVVLPVAYQFNPDLILISAGFDAGIYDPLGGYKLAPETFGQMVTLIKSVAPVIVALEGGYNLETTSIGMVNVARALKGRALPVPPLRDVNPEAANAMHLAVELMKPYWPMLQINKRLDPKIRNLSEVEKLTQKLDKCV